MWWRTLEKGILWGGKGVKLKVGGVDFSCRVWSLCNIHLYLNWWLAYSRDKSLVTPIQEFQWLPQFFCLHIFKYNKISLVSSIFACQWFSFQGWGILESIMWRIIVLQGQLTRDANVFHREFLSMLPMSFMRNYWYQWWLKSWG